MGNHTVATTDSTIRIFSMILAAVFVIMSSSTTAVAGSFHNDEIRFAVPPWPGVTVKTKVVADILNTLGYKTTQRNVGTALAFQGVANKDLDVYLAYWHPNMDGMAKKHLDKGTIKVIADNVGDAAWGIGVPGYVWDAGVHTVADLNKHRDRFGSTLYGIEKGSALNEHFRKAVETNAAGLGKWTVKSSSTAGMLLAVKHATTQHKWIAWGAWSPHWMMAAFNTKILNNSTGVLLKNSVTIRTVVATGFEKAHPNVSKFLKKFRVSSATQSRWINEYDKKKTPIEDVASRWIKSHHKQVSGWLEGVRSRDGKSANEVFWKEY